MKRTTGEFRQLSVLPRSTEVGLPPLRAAQNACYEALSLALKEGHVFAALTGQEGCGKTAVLEAVLADRHDRALRCIVISDPDKVPASLAEQIEQVAYAEVGKPENLERHVVLAIDDAHTASHELLLCLSRLAAMREPGRRVPQILLVGQPELWDRLATKEYEPLARRLAIRAALPAAEADSDPWALVENEVSQTMTQLRAEAEGVPDEPGPAADLNPVLDGATALPETVSEENVPPPNMYALFPDPPPKARSAARDTRRRMVMPLVGLFVGLAAFAFALSFYDWPDVLGDLPWAEQKPATPFVMPRSMQSPSFGLPQPPSTTPSKPASPPNPMVQAPAPLSKQEPAPVTQTAHRPIVAAPEPPPVTAPPAQTPATPVVPPSQTPATPVVPPAQTPATPVVPPAQTPATPVVTESSHAPIASQAVPAPTSAPDPASTASQAVIHEPAKTETPLAPAVVALLLRRGDEQSAIGDISAARLLYERAEESGSGLAAWELARTYDPTFLPPAIEAALADPAKARLWYQRAADLGNADAVARLKALNQGR